MKYACQIIVLAIVAISLVLTLITDTIRVRREKDEQAAKMMAIIWPAITLAYYAASIAVLKTAGAFSEVWP